MSEWLKEHAWKACVGETLPRVRIPLSPPNFDSCRSEFIPNVCRSVVSYQVMLRDANTDKRWGEVDLLGRFPQGWPVVVELKGASSKEPPLRGIVEGVAYAIALR